MRRTPARAVVVSLRPAEWTKNLFVFAAVVFSGLFEDVDTAPIGRNSGWGHAYLLGHKGDRSVRSRPQSSGAKPRYRSAQSCSAKPS